MAAGAQVDRPIGITTPLGPGALLLSAFSGFEAISQLFAYRVDLVAANDQPVPFEALLGQPATVALSLASGGSRYFSGIVQRFSQGARDRKRERDGGGLAQRRLERNRLVVRSDEVEPRYAKSWRSPRTREGGGRPGAGDEAARRDSDRPDRPARQPPSPLLPVEGEILA